MRTTMRILPLSLALALASACGSSPPTTYHVLSALPDEAGAAGERGPTELGPGVLVITVSGFPQYLDRREIARFLGDELELDEERFWAEPLQLGFARVLAESLSALGHPALPNGPLSRLLPEPRTLVIDVAELGVGLGNQGSVAATWIVVDATGEPSGPARRTRIQADPKGKTSTAEVPAVLSMALANLAREIASTLDDTLP